MELEVSYDESYCLEGRVERQRGATDSTYEAGEAVGMACVDRHIFFIRQQSMEKYWFTVVSSKYA